MVRGLLRGSFASKVSVSNSQPVGVYSRCVPKSTPNIPFMQSACILPLCVHAQSPKYGTGRIQCRRQRSVVALTVARARAIGSLRRQLLIHKTATAAPVASIGKHVWRLLCLLAEVAQ